MKPLIRAAAAALAVGLAVLAVLWFLWTAPGPVGDGGAEVVPVRIPRGATWAAAADSLTKYRLLSHSRILLLSVRLLGRESGLQAGLYDLDRGASPRDLVMTLTSGAAVPVRVTLPEGWNASEVAAELARQLGFSPDAFLAVADSVVRRLETGPWSGAVSLARGDSIQRQEVMTAGRSFHICEGYLAPDTYLFAEGSSPVTVAQLLVATQLERLAWADSLRLATMNLDPHRLLTLASIVEAEAKEPREQPKIAAVYINRMAAGWKLEADPTVAYVLDRKGLRLFHKDLEVDSRYNTYRDPGLPPGPIGNPGRGALLATARCDTACRALFFVSDGAAGHVFSRTAAEHAAAVARFRKIRAPARRAQGSR